MILSRPSFKELARRRPVVAVLFGTFLKDTPPIAAIAAAVTAVTVHFGLYYTGQYYFPYYIGQTVKNPGISTALGAVAALVVGGALHLGLRGRKASAASRGEESP